jgi:hypothetical protein
VHVRRADYIIQGGALPYSFYNEALEALLPHHGGDVWIVTDDRYDPFLRKFFTWKPKFFNGTALEALRFMSHSRQLVISQSSFSWWPTFLGDVERVICPLPQNGPWSDTARILGTELIEKDRFTCLQCEPYRRTKVDSAYLRLRQIHSRACSAYHRLKLFLLARAVARRHLRKN